MHGRGTWRAVGGDMQMIRAVNTQSARKQDANAAGCGRGHAGEGRARGHAHRYANETARAGGHANAGLGGVTMQMREKPRGEARICKWRAVGGDMQIHPGLVIMNMQILCK